MRQLRRSFTLVIAGLALVASCAETITKPPVDTVVVVPPPPPPTVSAILITGPTGLTVGRTATLTANPVTAAGVTVPGKTIAWTTSNAAAVTIDAAGLARAVGPGTARLTATVDGVSNGITVVSTDASLVTLTLAGITGPMVVGSTSQLTASGRDSVNQPVAVRALSYRSSNPAVVSVSSTGLVTAVSVGTATISAEGITVTAANALVNITVIPVPVSRIVIAPFDTILRFRFPKTIPATARDSAGNILQRQLTYRTSNVDVALLDPFGLATATGIGPVTITVTDGTKSDSVRLYVVPDSGFYIAATGGKPGDIAKASIDIPNGTGPVSSTTVVPADGVARINIVTNNGTYRARVATLPDPTVAPAPVQTVAMLVGSTATSLAVTIGPPSTVAVIPLKPYTATITAPSSVAVNSTVTVTWTFDESSQPFSFFPDRAPAGFLYYSTTNGADLSGTAVPATVTRDATTLISTFSATFAAPSTPGQIFFQVEADGAFAQLLFPIVYRGQTLRTITVQ